jgi:hypothetical protein
MYRDLVAPSGMIVFHDICLEGHGFNVGRFWQELRATSGRKSLEIIDAQGTRGPWERVSRDRSALPALGFGVLFGTGA